LAKKNNTLIYFLESKVCIEEITIRTLALYHKYVSSYRTKNLHSALQGLLFLRVRSDSLFLAESALVLGSFSLFYPLSTLHLLGRVSFGVVFRFQCILTVDC